MYNTHRYTSIDDFLITTPYKKQHSCPLEDLVYMFCIICQRGKLSLRFWAFAWLGDCANEDEAGVAFVQTTKMQSLYCLLHRFHLHCLDHFNSGFSVWVTAKVTGTNLTIRPFYKARAPVRLTQERPKCALHHGKMLTNKIPRSTK